MSRYYKVDNAPDDISIGFTFLAREYWGGVTNRELKTLMIDYALQYFPAVWFHVGMGNVRSNKAMQKIGAVSLGDVKMTIGANSAVWTCYKVDRDTWNK